MLRYVLVLVLALGWSCAAQAQPVQVIPSPQLRAAGNEVPGRIGIWTAPGRLGDTGNATAPGKFTVENGLVVNHGLQVSGTGAPWTNPTPPVNLPAVINRIADRLFIGKHLDQYDGSSTQCNNTPGAGCTWVGSSQTPLSGIMSYLERGSQILSYSETGQAAGFFAARTTDVLKNYDQHCCAMGVANFVYNDAIGAGVQPSWGTYNTSVRASGAGTTLGTEWDVANLGSYVDWAPYGAATEVNGLTVPLWIGCGGEMSHTAAASQLNPCSAAIGILANNMGNANTSFGKGIVFSSRALRDDGGVSHAVSMPTRAMLDWWIQNPAYASDNTQPSDLLVSAITSGVTSTAGADTMDFMDAGIEFHGPDGAMDFVIANNRIPGYPNVNYPMVAPEPSGNNPLILARGSDPDITLELAGKGNGAVIIDQGNLRTKLYQVAQLPACGSANVPVGTLLAVDDATANTFDAPLVGGGGNVMLALCGTSYLWRGH